MLGGIRTTIVNFAQMIADIGWSGAEAIQLKWQDATTNWEDYTG